MKIRVGLCVLFAGVVLSPSAPFQNLGFDAANTNNLVRDGFIAGAGTTGYGTVADLLPGWHLSSSGGRTEDLVWLNLVPIGLGTASLYDPSNPFFIEPYYHLPVEGLYSFAMIPQSSQLPPPTIHFTLDQTGDVPVNAQTLRFKSYGVGVEVAVNGVTLPVTYFPGPAKPYLDLRTSVGLVDIAAFAGQTVDLSFRSLDTYGTGGLVNGLDSISFVAVPEPTSGLIVLTGIGIFAVYRARRAKAVQNSPKKRFPLRPPARPES